MIDVKEGQWAIIRASWGFTSARADKVTARLIKTLYHSRYQQESRDRVIAAVDDMDSARRLVAKLDGFHEAWREARRQVEDEYDRAIAPITAAYEAQLEPHKEAKADKEQAARREFAEATARAVAEVTGK